MTDSPGAGRQGSSGRGVKGRLTPLQASPETFHQITVVQYIVLVLINLVLHLQPVYDIYVRTMVLHLVQLLCNVRLFIGPWVRGQTSLLTRCRRF